MTLPEALILRETLRGVPVMFSIYALRSRIRNTAHQLIRPIHPYTWFVVGEVDPTGMTTAEFFALPFAVFEAVWWQGSTGEADYDRLLCEVRHLAWLDITHRKPADEASSVMV